MMRAVNSSSSRVHLPLRRTGGEEGVGGGRGGGSEGESVVGLDIKVVVAFVEDKEEDEEELTEEEEGKKEEQE